MPRSDDLTIDQVMVNHLRALLGKGPLYGKTTPHASRHWREACGSYWTREHYSKLANPDCTRCGGSGLYDGWQFEMRCPCMGLQPKGHRGSGRQPHIKTTYAFQPKG